MPEWLNTLLSLIAGSMLAMVSGWVNDRRATARDQQARAEERRDCLRLRRDDFQREALIKLQDTAMRLARCAGAANHQDVMAFRKTGKWQKQMLSEDLDEQFRLQTAEMVLLATRIRDEKARNLAGEFREQCAEVGFAKSENAAERTLITMSQRLTELHERSGQLIRELDDAQG